VSATIADQYWGESSPVKEDQNLAIGLQMFADGLGQGLAYPIGRRCAHRIDEAQGRWLCSAGARWQNDMLKGPVPAVLEHFECGRSATENNRNIQVLGLRDREIASGIAQAFLLLERVIVFFVDDD